MTLPLWTGGESGGEWTHAKVRLSPFAIDLKLSQHCQSAIVVQSLGRSQLFTASWTAACQASLPFTISQSLLKLMSIESVMPPKRLILCCPLLLLPLIFSSNGAFSNESVLCIRWPRIGAPASPPVIPINIQGWFPCCPRDSLKSLLQHHSSQTSILWHSAFFKVQLSHSYMTTGNTIVWLNRPLSAKWCLCFLICCLGLSYLSLQGESIF